VYSLGMAIVYTAFGIAAALVGGGLAGALQNPWVLGAFALLLAGLSLSMFDVYELRLPSALHDRLTAWSGTFRGGRHLGVFAMGGLSALIVSPCIAAPLAGALVYISQTGDVLLGGTALFSLAAGMSVPLLLLGVSAGALLPRSGGWMTHVKHFFGLMLLATALWTVSPVMPAWAVMLLAAWLMLASAVYLGAFEPLHAKAHLPRSIAKGLGLLLAVLAAAQLAGVASGGRSLLQPLGHWGGASASRALPLDFQAVASVEALDAALSRSTRPVMLDWYADWCVACKEFEAFTLTQPAVREKLAGMTLLRIDVTANNPQDQALLRKYRLFGPPALLFFAPGGAELEGSRVIGFQDAPQFLAHLSRLPWPAGTPAP
jgi:thiol:disulfide interchange protein DsbD